MKPENVKKITTDKIILEFGNPRGWSFLDVKYLLEQEHHKTIVSVINFLVKDGILIYDEGRIALGLYDIDWDELEKKINE